MDNMQNTTSVSDVSNAIAKAITESRPIQCLVNQDENWLVQAQYKPGEQNITFYAEYLYKSGQRDNTLVNVTLDGAVTQSNPAVKIRKDLIEKMHSIVKNVSSQANKEVKCGTPASEVMAALVRHYDELPDDFSDRTMDDIERMKALGAQFLQADMASMDMQTKNSLSNTLVLEGQIVDSDMLFIKEVLEELESKNIIVQDTVQNKIQAELSKEGISPNEVYVILAKNLKYLVNDFMPDASRNRRTFGTVVGYRLYNKSNKPFTFKMLDYNTCKVIGEKTVGPADNIYVSRAELAMIGSRIEVCNRIANGRIRNSSKKTSNKIDFLRNFIIQRDESTKSGTTTDLTSIKPENWTRFVNFDTEFKKKQLERLLDLVLNQDRMIKKVNEDERANNLATASKHTLLNMNAVTISLDAVGTGLQQVNAHTVANVNLDSPHVDNKGKLAARMSIGVDGRVAQPQKKTGLFGMFKR